MHFKVVDYEGGVNGELPVIGSVKGPAILVDIKACEDEDEVWSLFAEALFTEDAAAGDAAGGYQGWLSLCLAISWIPSAPLWAFLWNQVWLCLLFKVCFVERETGLHRRALQVCTL